MDLTVLYVDDDGYVRAPAADCYRVLAQISAWPQWWAGTQVVEQRGKERFGVRIGRWPQTLQLHVRAHEWRDERGFHLAVTGDLVGGVEFWLEPGWDGTVVHHLATLRGARGARGARAGRRRTYRRYRRWVRRGLWGIKDQVQAAALAAGAP